MYKNPLEVAEESASRNIQILAVTNLPSHFRLGLPAVARLKSVQLALGLHPQLSDKHEKELPFFDEMLKHTEFVGEVGLDFYGATEMQKERQIKSFDYVAGQACRFDKIMSIHSRGAVHVVLDTLRKHQVKRAVFHWYSGPIGVAMDAIRDGYYFSVNPAMSLSQKGRELMRNLPTDRTLVESDGPYLKLKGKSIMPWDIDSIIGYLADLWQVSADRAKSRIALNYRNLTSGL
jgi:TatD DNase family protein